jgi:hypothetical protein
MDDLANELGIGLGLPNLKKPTILRKPSSAYILFGKEQRGDLVAKFPDAKVTEIVKEIAKLWAKQDKKARFEYK